MSAHHQEFCEFSAAGGSREFDGLRERYGRVKPMVEPLNDDRREHPDNPTQKIRHPRDVRILPPSRDFH